MWLQQSVGFAKQIVTETVQCWTLLKGTFNMRQAVLDILTAIGYGLIVMINLATLIGFLYVSKLYIWPNLTIF